MNKSKIEWCDYTWNPVTGCLHGCEYCYARRIINRFGKTSRYTPNEAGNKIFEVEKPELELDGKVYDLYPYGFEPTFHRYRLIEPIKLKKPSKIFVSSMGDLFGDWVPDEWIEEVYIACQKADNHKYIFLTKNPTRYNQVFKSDLDYRWYMWCGATITSDADIKKAWELLKLPRKVYTFLSIEPLLGAVDLNKYELLLKDWRKIYTIGKYLDWVIVGAQTGPGAKPPKPEWVQSIIDQCEAAGVPLFLKDNLNWPEKIQEFPEGM